MPISFKAAAMRSGVTAMLTPRASRTSALPHLLQTPLLPCLATATPAPAVAKAAAVETLNVWRPSPPVPQVSTMTAYVPLIGVDFSRMASTLPAIMSGVAPRMRRAVM